MVRTFEVEETRNHLLNLGEFHSNMNEKSLAKWRGGGILHGHNRYVLCLVFSSLAGTLPTLSGKHASHNWEFLVAVIVIAISVSILLTLFAKCHVVRRYLASYRHTRLKETDTVSHCESSGLFCFHETFLNMPIFTEALSHGYRW